MSALGVVIIMYFSLRSLTDSIKRSLLFTNVECLFLFQRVLFSDKFFKVTERLCIARFMNELPVHDKQKNLNVYSKD